MTHSTTCRLRWRHCLRCTCAAIILTVGAVTASAQESKLDTWHRVTSWDQNELLHNTKFAQLVRIGQQYGGIQQLVHVNEAVNKAIHPLVENDDTWSTPLDTLAKGTGDCEDYVIVKVAVFEALGHPAHLVIARTPQGWHAIASVELAGEMFYLDNRHNRLMRSLPADHQIVWRMYKGKQ